VKMQVQLEIKHSRSIKTALDNAHGGFF